MTDTTFVSNTQSATTTGSIIVITGSGSSLSATYDFFFWPYCFRNLNCTSNTAGAGGCVNVRVRYLHILFPFQIFPFSFASLIFR